MLIKPKYSPGDKAPMKWCTWQMYILPIGMFFSLAEFLSKTSDYIKWLQSESFPAYGVFVLVLSGAIAVGQWILMLFAANGLGRMEWRGPRCIYALFFYSAASWILSGILGWATFPEVLGKCLGSLIVFIPHYIYYQKRRNLFTPLPVQQTPQPAPAQPSSPPPEPVSPPAPEDTGEQTVLPEFAPPAPEPPKKKQLFFPILSAVLALVCVASLAANIIMGVQFGQQAIALKKAQNRATAYKTEIKNTEYKLDTISSVTRFAYYDDNMLKYHRFDCTDHPFDGNKVNAVHSPWYFDRLGYTPCRFCGAGNYDDLEFSPYTFFTREEFQLLHKEGR